MGVTYLAIILCNWNDDDKRHLYISQLIINTPITNSGHYIWYIYLNFAVTQTDDCDLGSISLMC